VAVGGIGSLGHLGIRVANKFGCRVAAIGRGSENTALAKKLGASLYIDSKATNAAQELQKMGGAQVILATAPNSKAMSELIDGLGPNGKRSEERRGGKEGRGRRAGKEQRER